MASGIVLYILDQKGDRSWALHRVIPAFFKDLPRAVISGVIFLGEISYLIAHWHAFSTCHISQPPRKIHPV